MKYIKKMQVPLYAILFQIIITDDSDYCMKYTGFGNEKLGVGTSMVSEDKRTGQPVISIVLSPGKERVTANIIAHESLHAATDVFFQRELAFPTHPNDFEALAYLTGWFTQQVTDTVRHYYTKFGDK
jgi:hypothetical protein